MRLPWVIAAWTLFAAGGAFAQGAEPRLDGTLWVGEREPQNSCALAQDLGRLTRSLLFLGRLNESDVDFVRFSSVAGTRIELVYFAQFDSMDTLTDPVLGVLGSDCQPLAVEVGEEGGSVLLRAPEDGVIIAALSACCDSEFTGAHPQRGNYGLALSELGDPIQEIRARVVDAGTGAPIPGADVFIQHCQGELSPCFSQASGSTGADGVVRFATMPPGSGGSRLVSGHYTVGVSAGDYVDSFRTGVYFPAVESLDLGDIPLQREPIGFELREGCGEFILAGGRCAFRVRVTNHSDAPLRGATWLFAGLNTGDAIGFTRFEIGPLAGSRLVARTPLRLGAGQSRELSFQLPLPPSANDASDLCVTAHAGLDPAPLYTRARSRTLFCLRGDGSGFRRASLPAAEAR